MSGTAAVSSFTLGGPQSDASSHRPTVADLLLHGAIVVTMDAKRRVFREGAIAVREGAIVDIGSSASLLPRWKSRLKIDLAGLVATPGLINSHIHLTGDQLLAGVDTRWCKRTRMGRPHWRTRSGQAGRHCGLRRGSARL